VVNLDIESPENPGPSGGPHPFHPAPGGTRP
jgi:hypothetical protein